MYTKDTFKRELEGLWSTRVLPLKPVWYTIGTMKVEIDDAWEMYLNAYKSTLSELLLGDVALRSKLDVLQNFGTTSGTQSTMERQTLYDGKTKIYPSNVNKTVMDSTKSYKKQDGIDHIRRGSVLNDGWWWPFKNDAWVIGGIHGLKRFHLTMASVPDDLIWDTSAMRLRVLGRELLGLAAFGYSLIGVPSWVKKDTPPTKAVPAPTTTPQPAVKTTPVPPDSIRKTIGNVFAPLSKLKAQGATFTTYYAELAKVKAVNDIRDGILKNEVAYEKYDFGKI
jgi:hypothetical protein